MNFKDLILPLSLALITTLAIQYFFVGRYTSDTKMPEVVSGQSFEAPKTKQELKPLNTEIDFVDVKPVKPTISEIETDWGHLVFSSDGASLERLEFKRYINDSLNIIGTIFPVTDTEKEQRCFLVALAQKTPYFYQLVDQQEDEYTVELIYQVKVEEGTIQKIFTIHKDKNLIDLTVHIMPKAGLEEPLEARIFYPAPIMPEIAKDDTISALVGGENNSIQKIVRNKLDIHKGWYTPTLFGADNRYFIHTMLNDPDHFTQRAYYKLSDHNKLFAILEGPAITQEHSWKISFYFGPKDMEVLSAIDNRLEQTLEFHWILAPIAKFLLALLKFFYGYLKNYGLAIILLTLLIKLLLLPFSVKGEESMKQRADLQKKLNYIRQKYKNDREALTRAQAELMQKHGMPGMAGCLPLLLQLPIFFVLSRVLSSSIELYHAPFAGWITDLSARDPYYVLPVLIGLCMLLQSLTVDSKQRLSVIAMALILPAFASNFSAGLSLYILISTALSVAQAMIQRGRKA